MKSQKPDIIVIVSDSLRQDHVGYYAGESSPAKTPRIDALFHDSIAFDNMYPQGLPTIPVRTDWVTGVSSLPGRSWQPLSSTDVPCAEILSREGYITAFITDMYHYFKPGMNFHRGFLEWQWIRGQEYDSCCAARPQKRSVDDYWKDSFPENWRNLLDAVCRNLDNAWRAPDFPCFKTFERASNWIRKNANHSKPFFLWVETFDPHEPWTPPIEFDLYKDPSYKGKDFILPPGGDASKHFSQEEIKRIRSLYAGEVSYLDAMVGEFIKTLKEKDRYDSSLIFYLSDHGHPLAEHGKFLKGPDRMYSELLKVPFAFKLPNSEYKGTRIREIAQFPDFLPTLLDAAGFGNDNSALQGHSLLPLVRGDVKKIRAAAISGYHSGADRCIRDETWSLVLRPGNEPDELYNLEHDPLEKNNVIDEHPEESRRLTSLFGRAFSVEAREIKGLQGKFELEHTGGTMSSEQ